MRSINWRWINKFSTGFALMMLAFTGCSKSGPTVTVKAPGVSEHEVAVKSAAAFPVTKTFTDLNGKISTAVSYRVYVASYDLDTSQFARSMDKAMTADDQIRVVFSLVGAEGTTDTSPVATDTYAAKADKFMKVEDVSLVTSKGGQDNKLILDRAALTGEVKVDSATADTITGSINLVSGETSIKGPFTAKIVRRS